jgi:hypothetical protein
MSIHIAVDIDANWDKDQDTIDLPSFIRRALINWEFRHFLSIMVLRKVAYEGRSSWRSRSGGMVKGSRSGPGSSRQSVGHPLDWCACFRDARTPALAEREATWIIVVPGGLLPLRRERSCPREPIQSGRSSAQSHTASPKQILPHIKRKREY